MGADYSLLSNREKALVVGALEGEFPIARMLRAIGGLPDFQPFRVREFVSPSV